MYAYTRIEHEYNMLNEMIESEMHKVRDNAIRKVSSILAHPQNLFLSKDFALTLAYSYFDSYSPAENITTSLDLSKLDFLALQEDFDAFKAEYLKHYEEALNF